MRKKYSIKKHGNTFKVFEHLTKQFIAQSKNRNVLTKLLVKLNKGAKVFLHRVSNPEKYGVAKVKKNKISDFTLAQKTKDIDLIIELTVL